MGWLDDIGKFVAGSSTGGVGNWITNNKSWLDPVISLGTGALQQNQKDNTQQEYLDYLRGQEDRNYENSVADIDAYNAQLAASQAASGARAAAARQTEANRMKASKKANKASQRSYKDILAMYAPFRDAATTLLPQKMQTYQDSLGLQKSMLNYVQKPEQIAKMDAAGPAWNVKVPLPDYIRQK